MSLTQLNTYPEQRWWQRWLQKLVGGQDLVAVVATYHYHDGRTATEVSWFQGVNMREPVTVDVEDSIAVAIMLPETKP
jgi:hypothetical protein